MSGRSVEETLRVLKALRTERFVLPIGTRANRRAMWH